MLGLRLTKFEPARNVWLDASAVLRRFGNRPIAEYRDFLSVRGCPRANNEESVGTPHRQVTERLDETARGQVIGKKCRAGEGYSLTRGGRLKRHVGKRKSQAAFDTASVGKPFLAFVHVNAALLEVGKWAPKIKRFPEVEEIHSVAGDNCVILKVRTASAQAMEQFLSQLYALPGVRATKSFVVLSTYVERPVQATVTSEWPEIPPRPAPAAAP